ncbi:MAG: ATP-binding protein [Candidatus Omnitrophota bacterium]|nr:ATP-binding protein [Candidatus Omnitrophota bacterium]
MVRKKAFRQNPLTDKGSMYIMNNMVIEQKLKLSLKDVPGLVEGILEKMESLGIYNDIPMELRLAIEEALTNAVKHGNKLDPDKNVSIRVETFPGSVQIEVEDEGAGFDHGKVPLPTDDENIWKTSGRGVFLIRHFMDKAEYSQGGRRLKLCKCLKPK